MKIQTFVIGCVLALALFLFAQQRSETTQPGGFREVVDLTHSLPTPASEPAIRSAYRLQPLALEQKVLAPVPGVTASEQFSTRMDAPARLARGLWTVDQIPAGRLIAPLVVLDASKKVDGNPDYEISVQDIARWEHANGQIPLGAVVMARTGWGSRWTSERSYRNTDSKGVMHFPGYSEDAAKFLAEGRNALGLGIDTANLDRGSSKQFPVAQYTLAHGLYVLTNVANLDRMPPNGAIAMVAPMKVAGGSAVPVRILALVR
ncbi:MAG TPA: cyclase family protein [Terriglobales bacterium]|jgi:kynurenine formamidase|nr:cyclase family protein [Terriglobales bacterium]